MNKITLTSLAVATLSGGIATAANGAEPRTDVLFIFVDDLTFDGLNSLGTSDVISPNIDNIVRNGVSFSNTYNMGGWNGAISTASRSQLMTGLYLWNTHNTMLADQYASLYNQRELWPQIMKDAGYKTFHTGKWHMSHIDADQLYDEVIDVRPGMPAITRNAYNRPLSRKDNRWQPWDKSEGGFWEGGTHWSEVLANNTIEFICENSNSEEPLFICAAFNAPHDPRQAPKEFVDMYNVDDIEVPKSFMAENPYMEQMASGRSLRDEQLAPWPRTEFAVQKHRQEYYAIITHLDYQVGRIIEELEKSGRADNTLIIFSADNGLATGRHGYVGKQSMYEHSMKVPLVFSGCGLPAGESREQLCYLQDMVPTILDLIKVDKPTPMEFVSLFDIAHNAKSEPVRDAVYGAYIDKQRMVRDERYKLFFVPDADLVMLFDIESDPHELVNLYGKGAKYMKIARDLAEKYLVLAKESGDEYDLAGQFPELFK
ncbi:MAG: sulfatase-like hydrolase/transferase [Rikenellaceae bacterium]